MTAREKFSRGDRVRLNEHARAWGLPAPSDRLGEVVGFSRDQRCVTIQWAGQKSLGGTYHMDFVERA